MGKLNYTLAEIKAKVGEKIMVDMERKNQKYRI